MFISQILSSTCACCSMVLYLLCIHACILRSSLPFLLLTRAIMCSAYEVLLLCLHAIFGYWIRKLLLCFLDQNSFDFICSC